MNFLKGSTIKASFLSVCVCVYMITCPSTCLQGEDATHGVESEGNRGMPVGNCSWCFSHVVFVVCDCALCVCAFVRVCVYVCAKQVIEAGSLVCLPVLIKMKETQMWMRDYLI